MYLLILKWPFLVIFTILGIFGSIWSWRILEEYSCFHRRNHRLQKLGWYLFMVASMLLASFCLISLFFISNGTLTPVVRIYDGYESETLK